MSSDRTEKLSESYSTIENNLPEGWIKITLDQILQALESGSRPKGGVRGITEGVPSIGGEHINENGGFRFETIKFVPHNFFNRMTQGGIQTGDILIVKDGATTGKVALVRDDFPYNPAVVNEHVFICRPDEGVHPPFLFYFLFSKEGQDRILENFRGSAQGGINQSFAPGTNVPLAPLAEQKWIVAKVEELFERIHATKGRLTKVSIILKRFRQSVLAAACSGRLTADWREQRGKVTPVDHSIQDILEQREAEWLRTNGSSKKYKPPQNVKKNGLQELSEGWKYINSDALFSFVTSGSRGWAKHYATTGRIFIRVGNLDHDTISLDLTDVQHVNPPAGQEKERTRVQLGDILISITADVGMVALVQDEIGEAYVNQHVSIARPVTNVFKPYLAWYLASREGGQIQFQDLQRGATKVGLGLDDIRSVAIPFPPIEEQQEIVRRVESMFKLADAVEKRVAVAATRTEKLTHAILAKAFRGELVPTEAELARRECRAYEPASDLLARIKADRESRGASKTSLRSPNKNINPWG